jgi:hypothetical protein
MKRLIEFFTSLEIIDCIVFGCMAGVALIEILKFIAKLVFAIMALI